MSVQDAPAKSETTAEEDAFLAELMSEPTDVEAVSGELDELAAQMEEMNAHFEGWEDYMTLVQVRPISTHLAPRHA